MTKITLTHEDGTTETIERNINVDISFYENQRLMQEKINRLTELTKDLAQVEAGLIIDDLETRKAEFRTLLNEVRVLQGKEPRQTSQ